MIQLQSLLKEATFETYFVQVILKMRSEFNFTEIYNQIRGIKDVIVIKVIENDSLKAASSKDSHYSLLDLKFLSEGNSVETIKAIKHEALKIPGLLKFHVRSQTLLRIRNY